MSNGDDGEKTILWERITAIKPGVIFWGTGKKRSDRRKRRSNLLLQRRQRQRWVIEEVI